MSPSLCSRTVGRDVYVACGCAPPLHVQSYRSYLCACPLRALILLCMSHVTSRSQCLITAQSQCLITASWHALRVLACPLRSPSAPSGVCACIRTLGASHGHGVAMQFKSQRPACSGKNHRCAERTQLTLEHVLHEFSIHAQNDQLLEPARKRLEQ